MSNHTYSQPLNVSQQSFVNANLSDLQRLGGDVLGTGEINDRCTKLTWKKAFHANVITRVPDASGRKYRVRGEVREMVERAEYATLPCGCTDFTNTGDGYECSCGRVHDRDTVEAYCERVP